MVLFHLADEVTKDYSIAKDCDSSAGIIRIRFAGRGLNALLSARVDRAPRANCDPAGKTSMPDFTL